MSYQSIVEGLHERFATIEALENRPILAYEPTSIQDVPCLYTLLDSFERSSSGQLVAMRYRILHRLCVAAVEMEQSELDLMPFVNSIPASIDADPQLGGRLQLGIATIKEAQAVFVRIGSVLYRALDFYSDVLEKGGYRNSSI